MICFDAEWNLWTLLAFFFSMDTKKDYSIEFILLLFLFRFVVPLDRVVVVHEDNCCTIRDHLVVLAAID